MATVSERNEYSTLVKPTLIQDFDTLSDFTIVKNAACTAEIRTTFFKEGSGALYLDNTPSPSEVTVDIILPFGGIRFSSTTPVDMLLRTYLPSAFNATSITIYLGTSSSFATQCNGTTSILEGKRDQPTYKTGWNNFTINRATFISGSHTNLDTGASLWTHMRIRMELGKGPIHLDSLWLNTRSRTKVVMMFDDAAASIDTPFADFGNIPVWQYMQNKGIVGTVYVNASLIGGAGVLTETQLNTLQSAGWDIANHLYDHASIENLTDAQVKSQYETNKEWMIARGYTVAAEHMAYPTGAFNVDNHPALLKSLGAKTARSIQSGPIYNLVWKLENLHNLWAQGVTTAMPASTITTGVSNAVKEGKHYATYWHNLANPSVGPNDWLPASAKTVIDYVSTLRQQGLVDTQTISQWFADLALPFRK